MVVKDEFSGSNKKASFSHFLRHTIFFSNTLIYILHRRLQSFKVFYCVAATATATDDVD
jgi:hypothetical protein